MAAQYKHCPGCCETGETIPADEFDKDKNQPDGLAELCKECDEYSITKPEPKPEPKAPKPITEKNCNTCGQTKPISEFHKKAYNKDGYNSQCKQCKAKYVAAYSAKRRGEVAPAQKTMSVKAGKQTMMPGQKKNTRCVIKPEVKEETQTPYTTSGPKESAGKTPWSIFPFQEAEHVVRVFDYGVKKYHAPFTYRKGIQVERLAEAVVRHCVALLAGERIDPESGELHAAHIAANGLMIISQSVCDV